MKSENVFWIVVAIAAVGCSAGYHFGRYQDELYNVHAYNKEVGLLRESVTNLHLDLRDLKEEVESIKAKR